EYQKKYRTNISIVIPLNGIPKRMWIGNSRTEIGARKSADTDRQIQKDKCYFLLENGWQRPFETLVTWRCQGANDSSRLFNVQVFQAASDPSRSLDIQGFQADLTAGWGFMLIVKYLKREVPISDNQDDGKVPTRMRIDDYFLVHGAPLHDQQPRTPEHQIYPSGIRSPWIQKVIMFALLDSKQTELSYRENFVNPIIAKLFDNVMNIIRVKTSSIVQALLLDVHAKGRKFNVIILKRVLIGKKLLKRLMDETHSFMSNGALYSQVGTAMVAMMAKEKNIPVIVC
ncbi:5033_t:CDS:2, partial [Diversispora eburnea]